MSATADNIREFLNREPFLPFRLVMTSGKTHDVVSANSAMRLKAEVFVVFPDRSRGTHVPFLHIASIEAMANWRGRRAPKRRR